MRRLVLHWVCVFVLVALPVGGCSDETAAAGGTGGSGDTGGDGGTGGVGGSGDTGGYGGSGGMGGMPECESAIDCADRNDCTDDTCKVGMCEFATVEDGMACDDGNECTVGGTCAEGACDSAPVDDNTACGDDAGTCQQGSCRLACDEQGILDAIAAGGGPYTFDCDGPTVVTTTALITIDNDVILDGEGNLILEDWGISIAEVVVALSRMTLRRGRGLYNNGSLELNKVTMSGNYCRGQCGTGGIYNEGTVTLVDSTLSNNGGAGRHSASVLNFYGDLTVVGSTISDSTEAGILSLGGSVVVEGSAITDNPVGIVLCEGEGFGGAHRVVNSTVSGNDFFGIFAGLPTSVVNSTIDGSRPFGTPSDVDLGISCGGDPHGLLTLRGTLIDGDCAVGIVSEGYNIESPGDTCGLDQEGDRVRVSVERMNLGPLADNGGGTETRALGEGSVAIDRIPKAECVDADGEPLATDQRGEPRLVRWLCDVGAFEVQLGSL